MPHAVGLQAFRAHDSIVHFHTSCVTLRSCDGVEEWGEAQGQATQTAEHINHMMLGWKSAAPHLESTLKQHPRLRHQGRAG